MILNQKSFRKTLENAKNFIDKKNKTTNGIWIANNTATATNFEIYYKELLNNLDSNEEQKKPIFLDKETIKKIIDYIKKSKLKEIKLSADNEDIFINDTPLNKVTVNPEEMPSLLKEELMDRKGIYNVKKYKLSNKLLESVRTIFSKDSLLTEDIKEGFNNYKYATFIQLINDKATWTNGYVMHIIYTNLSDINVFIPIELFLKYKKFTEEFTLSHYNYTDEKDREIMTVTLDNGTISITYRLALGTIKHPTYDQMAKIINGAISLSKPIEYEKEELLKEANLSKRNNGKEKINQATTIKLKAETDLNFIYLNFILSFFTNKVKIYSDNNKYNPVVFEVEKERIITIMPLK
jgi:hypothetical protein